jgi:hypothetical protein
MEFDFVKELYFRELDGRHDQNGRASLYLAVLTVLGALLVFCLRQHPTGGFSSLYFLLILAFLLYALAIIFVLLANLEFGYLQLPYASELDAYHRELQDYYRQNPEVRGEPGQDLKDILYLKMVEAATHNSQTNLTRAARYYAANYFLAGAIVFGLLATVPVRFRPSHDGSAAEAATPIEGETQIDRSTTQPTETNSSRGEAPEATPQAETAGEYSDSRDSNAPETPDPGAAGDDQERQVE